jgi:Zn-dependent protease
MELLYIVLSIVILIYSSILHEIAHGFVAYRLGDPTAKLHKRLTLNPASHIDLNLTILMPLLTYFGSGGSMIFGGAKPVPVDPFNLREARKDLAIVSLVGPLTNIILAIIGSLLIHIIYPELTFSEVMQNDLPGFILGSVIRWNLLLAIFNLIPIPPLDGSKIFSLLLPKKDAAIYLSFGSSGMGFLLLMILLFFPIGGFSLMSIVAALIKFALTLLGF